MIDCDHLQLLYTFRKQKRFHTSNAFEMVACEAKCMHALIPVGFSPLFSFTTPYLKK